MSEFNTTMWISFGMFGMGILLFNAYLFSKQNNSDNIFEQDRKWIEREKELRKELEKDFLEIFNTK